MADVSYIIRSRERKEQRSRRNPWGKIALGCSLLISLLIALAGMFVGLVYIELTRNLPSPQALAVLIESPDGILNQPTRLYDRTGEHILYSLENPAAIDREYLTLDTSKQNHIPPNLITTTIAIADPGFWIHPGFVLDSLNPNTPPTIAQRLVSDLLLWNEPPGLRRTLRERLLAAQITSRYGRERVLTWYLNTANYGRLAFGADAAARVYFDKPAAELTLAEAAMLATVMEAPALNPLDAPQAAIERQGEVLQNMAAQGVITHEQADRARNETLTFHNTVPPEHSLAPAFANLVLENISSRIDLARLERGGYRVLTSLNYDLQLQAACAADALKARLVEQPVEVQAANGNECLSARLLPTIPVENGANLEDLTANIVIYDPNNGEVLALVGEITPGKDPAHKPGHPAGTILTPFVYLTAFTRGLSPATLVWDVPNPLQTLEDTTQYRGPVRLRTALANDYPGPLSQIITQVGLENVWKTLQQIGMVSEEATPKSADQLIAQTQTPLLELSQAYSIFASQGNLTGEPGLPNNSSNGVSSLKPVTVLQLEDTFENLWPGQDDSVIAGEISQRPVINPQLAYLVTDVLSDEISRWSSLGHPNPLEIGRPVAAKIGQTAAGNDAWTLGYTPEALVGVWLGTEDANPSSQDLPRQAAALWHAVMQFTLQDLPAQRWQEPLGITRLNVCNPSGLLPSVDCPDVVSEVFLTGTEPTQVDNLYQTFQINRETGRLATAFTPPELIEERVYLIVPPEAEAWARSSGLPTPPEEYDVILDPSTSTEDVQLTSPEMFSNVSGEVSLEGSATGEDFAFYRLQAGKGLNPRTWLQIGEDATQPVQQGLLGVWDTQGFEGLHTLQLQVVRNDQGVDSAVIQVTVDNQPPEVSITSPLAGQDATSRSGEIIFLADAQDNLSIQRVEFYLDDKLVDTRFQPPYAIPWQSRPGEHSLRVVAEDKAGNESEAVIEFSVAP